MFPVSGIATSADCQRVRRRGWQNHRFHTDEDYHEGEAHAPAQWHAGHSTCWREYRTAHPAYLSRPEVIQRGGMVHVVFAAARPKEVRRLGRELLQDHAEDSNRIAL